MTDICGIPWHCGLSLFFDVSRGSDIARAGNRGREDDVKNTHGAYVANTHRYVAQSMQESREMTRKAKMP